MWSEAKAMEEMMCTRLPACRCPAIASQLFTNAFLGPADHRLSDGYCFFILLTTDRLFEAWISPCDRVGSQLIRFPDGLRHGLTTVFNETEE